MICNEKQYRHAMGNLSELSDELRRLLPGRSNERGAVVDSAVVDAPQIQIEDLERKIAEYEDLKAGCLLLGVQAQLPASSAKSAGSVR